MSFDKRNQPVLLQFDAVVFDERDNKAKMQLTGWKPSDVVMQAFRFFKHISLGKYGTLVCHNGDVSRAINATITVNRVLLTAHELKVALAEAHGRYVNKQSESLRSAV